MTPAPTRIKVWDLPVRLFHWLLLLLAGFSWWSGATGDAWMPYHAWSGCAILVLLLFRLAWGVWGSDTARFAQFVRGPRATFGYLRGVLRRQPAPYAGHNPLGGWMIVSLLMLLLIQTVTGLFGNDDSDYEAPLAHWLPHQASSLVTTLHTYNFYLLLGLVSLHVAAVVTHQWLRRDGLIEAMFSGMKRGLPGAAVRLASNRRAVLLLGAVGAIVGAMLWLVGDFPAA